VAGAGLRDVVPEQKKQLITSPSLFAGRREYREQCEPSTMVSVLAEERVIARRRQREGAKRSEVVAMS
jgi:hypothetical protein